MLQVVMSNSQFDVEPIEFPFLLFLYFYDVFSIVHTALNI
jgi:hypothetical protein